MLCTARIAYLRKGEDVVTALENCVLKLCSETAKIVEHPVRGSLKDYNWRSLTLLLLTIAPKDGFTDPKQILEATKAWSAAFRRKWIASCVPNPNIPKEFNKGVSVVFELHHFPVYLATIAMMSKNDKIDYYPFRYLINHGRSDVRWHAFVCLWLLRDRVLPDRIVPLLLENLSDNQVYQWIFRISGQTTMRN